MAKQNDAGVYQLPNGNWAYRFTFTVEGKKKNRKGTKDEFGNLLTTKRAAILARAAAVTREQEEQHMLLVPPLLGFWYQIDFQFCPASVYLRREKRFAMIPHGIEIRPRHGDILFFFRVENVIYHKVLPLSFLILVFRLRSDTLITRPNVLITL